MKKNITICVILINLCNLCYSQSNLISASDAEISKHFIEGASIMFEENLGQMTDMEGNPVDEVLFRARANGLDIYITTTGISYVFKEIEVEEDEKVEKYKKGKPGEREKVFVQWSRVDMELLGAKITADRLMKEAHSTHYNNYYLAHCPQGITGVREYKKIIFKDVYKGIDWVLYGYGEEGLKYDFIVQPGADIKQIKWKYHWHKGLQINKRGELEVGCPQGEIIEKFPVGLQDNEKVKVKYRLKNEELTFDVKDYDLSRPLIIDPELIWGTYYGGDDVDGITSVTTSANGTIFMAGWTASLDFPTENPGGSVYFQGPGYGPAFILKFSPTGVLQWATYYGGDDPPATADDATSICCNNNSVWVTGFTPHTNFPVYNPGGGAYFQDSIAGGEDMFILQFDTTGIRQWATYYGGTVPIPSIPGTPNSDRGMSIHSNGSSIWITGSTNSFDFPLMDPGGGAYFQDSIPGYQDSSAMPYNAFVVKFTTSGVLQWATYYGGSGTNGDAGYSIHCDGSSVWVTGKTFSSDFPTFNPGGGAYFQDTLAGQLDAFILQFDTAGVQQWATYYGGTSGTSSADIGHSIYSDSSSVWVLGETWTNDFPTQAAGGSAYFQDANAGGKDVFILQFNTTGVRQWATYFGGSGNDGFWSAPNDQEKELIACNGGIFITGQSASPNFPLVNPGPPSYFQGTLAGGAYGDAFISAFDANRNLIWSTFNGTSDADCGTALAILPDGCLIATGQWMGNGSNGLLDPGGGAYYDDTFNGGQDAYIMKFCPSLCEYFQISVNPNLDTICPGDSITLNAGGAQNYNWSPAGGLSSTTGDSVIASPNTTTTYTIIGDSATCSDTTTVIITVNPSPTANITPSGSTALCSGDSVGLQSDTATTYEWLFNGTGTGQTTQNIIVDTAGNYQVVVSNTFGCIDTSAIEIITVNPLPTADITLSGPTTFCSGDSVELQSDTATIYEWLFNGAGTGQATQNITVYTSGDYQVVASNAFGCIDTSAIETITVNPLPTANAGSDVAICQGYDTTLNASGGISYGWSPSTGLSADNISNPIANPSSTTIYTVTVTDTSGCTDTDDITLTVNLLPIANAGSDTTICQGDNTILTATGIGSYLWSTGDTSLSIEVNPSIDSIYYVTFENNCGSSTDSLLITVYPLPYAYAGPDTTILAGSSIQLSGSGGTSYLWSTGNTTQLITVSPAENTTYYLNVTDENGCSDIDTITIYIDFTSTIFIPNIFSPNDDGENDILYVMGKGIQYFEFFIYDRWGEKVFESTNIDDGWDGTFKGKPMNTGVFVYFVTVKFYDGNEITEKGNVTLIR